MIGPLANGQADTVTDTERRTNSFDSATKTIDRISGMIPGTASCLTRIWCPAISDPSDPKESLGWKGLTVGAPYAGGGHQHHEREERPGGVVGTRG